MKKVELLAPAGDIEILKVAFAYGADAVYISGKRLGMRAKAKNFDLCEIEEGINHAHSLGKKVYVTINTILRNEDFIGLEEYIKDLQKIKADALIISDLGAVNLVKKTAPQMEIHISTQANSINYASVGFFKDLGAGRVILARELSLKEIKEISQKTKGIELEAFVHGAMCMAYSGRCLISNYLNNRDANRGGCSQPCRWKYALVEEKSGEVLPAYEDEDGTHILNSKDLCMVTHLPKLIDAGITSLKIEGRMKTSYYVGVVTKTYKEALDDYNKDPDIYNSKLDYYQEELNKVGYRGYTTGFYNGKITEADHNYSGNTEGRIQDFLAIVEECKDTSGLCQVQQRNKFKVGDTIEIFRANGPSHIQTIKKMYDENDNEIQSAPHPKQKIKLYLDVPVARYDMLRLNM